MNLIKTKLLRFFRKTLAQVLTKIHPDFYFLSQKPNWSLILPSLYNSEVEDHVKLYPPYSIRDSQIGLGTYISVNSNISMAKIGKFCSIGPNFYCGWGIHPIHGISTAPMFYSTLRQNGLTLSSKDKIEERKPIVIGNDVFIGMNVTVLDGVKIGDGAVIGAGSVVSKDIPPYAVAVGSPIKIIKYRFEQDVIDKLLLIKWWDFPLDRLTEVEQYFFNVHDFVEKHSN